MASAVTPTSVSTPHTGQIVDGLRRPSEVPHADGEELPGGNLPDFGNDPEDKEEKGKKLEWYKALPWFVRGDIDGFTFVFSNNLATALSGAAMLRDMLGDEIVFKRIMPGLGLSMIFGCTYYMVQAMLTAGRRGRSDMTAQPFGINTPGMFAWNSGIILGIFFAEGGFGNQAEAAEIAWSVAVVANLLQGLVNVTFSLIGPYINSAVPIVALVGSLASVGLAFLYGSTLQGQTAAPIVTFASFFLLIMALYADVSLPNFPKTLLPVAFAAVLAWITGLTDADNVSEAMSIVGFSPPITSFETFSYMGKAFTYIGLILPVTLSVSVGSIQCRQLAEQAGDNYNLRFTMAGDGIATIIAACFGCPWGMTVFIGHPAVKAMGAKIGYQWMTALTFGIVTWSGLPKLILAIIPPECMNCIVMFVGLAVCGDAIFATPARHNPAFFVSLVPCFLCWCFQQCQSYGAAICDYQAENAPNSTCLLDPYSAEPFTKTPTLHGLYLMGQGYLLTSIYWCSIMVYVIDRNFLKATFWALVCVLSASVGMIHADKVFLPWDGPAGINGGMPEHIRFTIAYLCVAGIFGCTAGLQHVGKIPIGPVDDDSKVEDQEEEEDDSASEEERP